MKIDKSSILYGTLILTITNIIVRILGFIYRIFLSRTIGPEGIGIVQLIFPIYVITITLTASGIPIAVSRIVSQRKTIGDIPGIKKTILISIIMVTVISILISCIILFNAKNIASYILKDERTLNSLLVFFPCILITGLGSVIKGYFYGIKDIHPPALAEIIEQIVRMTLVVFLLLFIQNLSITSAAAIVILGMVMGELISLIYLNYNYCTSVKSKAAIKSSSPNSILINILIIAIPITLTRLASSLMMASNSILIPRRLMAGGMLNSEAISTYGILSGMVMPLLFLPFTLISALSVVIIPNLSENLALKDWSSIRSKISKSIFMSSLTAFSSMAIIIPLAHPIGIILYKQPAVGKYLIPLACSMVFLCLQQNLSSILNGLGKQNRAAYHFLAGGVVQLICTYFLVSNPLFGIYGFIIGFILSSIIVSSLNFITVIHYTKLVINPFECFIKPGITAFFTGTICRFTFVFLITHQISYGVALFITATAGTMLLGIFLLLIGSLPYWIIKELRLKFNMYPFL